MKIKLIVVGKTSDPHLELQILNFIKRIRRYIDFEILIIPNSKNKIINTKTIVKKEGIEILKKIEKNQIIILLDEKGKNYSSIEFAKFLENKLIQNVKDIVFVVGGANGLDKEVYSRSNYILALSKMTFSHQMVRLIFSEQIYRAFTIINNHPYHNK